MVVMGRVTAPHGVHGWVRVRAFTADPAGLSRYLHWWLRDADGWTRRRVEASEARAQGLYAKLEGCDDRSAAETLSKREVAVPRADLPATEDGQYYWTDLVGAQVLNREGAVLGSVESLLETGANDVLVVRGERERLIPFVEPVIVGVDLERASIVVDWGVDY
jgi:16S rRNA processing protein RimM